MKSIFCFKQSASCVTFVCFSIITLKQMIIIKQIKTKIFNFYILSFCFSDLAQKLSEDHISPITRERVSFVNMERRRASVDTNSSRYSFYFFSVSHCSFRFLHLIWFELFIVFCSLFIVIPEEVIRRCIFYVIFCTN